MFSKGEKWYDKLFNVKYLRLFHHFKVIYQFPKHIIVLAKIVANAALMYDFLYRNKHKPHIGLFNKYLPKQDF